MRRNGVMFALGAIVALVMLPATVEAAASLFKLQGYSGAIAQVDGGRRLMAAESDPSTFVTATSASNGFNNCVLIYSTPSTKALVVRQVRFQVTQSTLDALHTFYLYPNRTCTGVPMMIYQPSHLGSDTETIEPGFPIKPSSGVSGIWLATGTYAVTEIYGYSLPPTAVP